MCENFRSFGANFENVDFSFLDYNSKNNQNFNKNPQLILRLRQRTNFFKRRTYRRVSTTLKSVLKKKNNRIKTQKSVTKFSQVSTFHRVSHIHEALIF